MKIFPVSGFDEITLIGSSVQPNRNVRNVQHINLSRKWHSEDAEQQNIIGRALKGYQECGLTGKVGGTATGLSATTKYYFKVAEDDQNLTEYSITTEADVTFTAIIALLNTATTGIATWSIVSGDLRCTSDSYGSVSTIRMTAGTTSTDLFAALTDFTAFDKPVFGSGIALPSVAILDGHNLTKDAVVKIQGNIADSWPKIDRGDCESTTPPMIFGETVPFLSNATFTRNSAQKHDGIYSYRVRKTIASGTAGIVYLVDNTNTDDMHGFIAGHTYTWSLWVYVPIASGISLNEVFMRMRDYDSSWAGTDGSHPTAFDTWQEISVTRMIRAGATAVNIRLSMPTTVEDTEFFDIDDIELKDDSMIDITMTRGTNGIYYALTGFLEKEYWRFLITDPSNTDGHFKVGRLWLGDSIDISGPERASVEKRVDTTVKSFSRSGQSSSDTGYRYRVYEVSFPHWTDTMKDNVELFIKAVRGAPFYVLFDEDKIAKMPLLYAVLGNEIDYENIADLVDFRSGLIFREVF